MPPYLWLATKKGGETEAGTRRGGILSTPPHLFQAHNHHTQYDNEEQHQKTTAHLLTHEGPFPVEQEVSSLFTVVEKDGIGMQTVPAPRCLDSTAPLSVRNSYHGTHIRDFDPIVLSGKLGGAEFPEATSSGLQVADIATFVCAPDGVMRENATSSSKGHLGRNTAYSERRT